MININKKYTKELANSYSYGKPIFHMEAIGGDYTGTIIYPIIGENGEAIDNITVVYKGEEWNTFWKSFNSFDSLIQPLKEINTEVIIPTDIETEVINVEKVIVIEAEVINAEEVINTEPVI